MLLLEHLPLERGESPVCPPHSSDATQLSLDLALALGVPEARISLPDAVEGMVCALIEGDGCCCRVRVMQFSEPLDLYFHHKEQARVYGLKPQNLIGGVVQLSGPFLGSIAGHW